MMNNQKRKQGQTIEETDSESDDLRTDSDFDEEEKKAKSL